MQRLTRITNYQEKIRATTLQEETDEGTELVTTHRCKTLKARAIGLADAQKAKHLSTGTRWTEAVVAPRHLKALLGPGSRGGGSEGGGVGYALVVYFL